MTRSDGLPDVGEYFGPEHIDRWPMGSEKFEVDHGVLVWYGRFDERDVQIAERTFPGWRVTIDGDGCVRVGPGLT